MQRTLTRTATLLGLSALLAGTAAAQGRGHGSSSYPPGFKPPPGMCRVWIQGVPPGRQPGVTDCVSARATALANSTVLYGDRTDNPAYHGRAGTYSRTVYDAYGNRVIQRVQRNADGSQSVLSSTSYGVSRGGNGNMRGKMLPRTRDMQVYTDKHGNGNGRYKQDRDERDDKWRDKKDHDDHGDDHGDNHRHKHGDNEHQ